MIVNYKDQWIVIIAGKVIGAYDTRDEATVALANACAIYDAS